MIDPTNDPLGDLIEQVVENSVCSVEKELHDIVLDSVTQACKEIVDEESLCVPNKWEDELLDYRKSMTDLVTETIMRRFK